MSSQPLTLQTGITFNQQDPPLLNHWNLNGYLFDAWLRLHHNSGLTITRHPVQVGAEITDHAYRNPRRFSFEIGVTDVAKPIQVQGGIPINANPTRALNAYKVLQKLQSERKPLYLVSKYGYFDNILIESIDIPDDWTTQNAIKATVTLTEIIIVELVTKKVSGLPQTTDQTNRGQLSGYPTVGTREAVILSGLRNGIPLEVLERGLQFLERLTPQ